MLAAEARAERGQGGGRPWVGGAVVIAERGLATAEHGHSANFRADAGGGPDRPGPTPASAQVALLLGTGGQWQQLRTHFAM